MGKKALVINNERFCKKCDKFYPLTEEHWYDLRGKKISCKVCSNKRNSIYRKNNSEEINKKARDVAKSSGKIKENKEGFRKCSKCQGDFPLTGEYWYLGKSPAHKPCELARCAKNRMKNPERRKEIVKKSAEKHRDTRKKYYIDNKTDIRIQQSERYRTDLQYQEDAKRRSKEWRVENRERNNSSKNKRKKQRQKEDVCYKLICLLRTRLYNAIKGGFKSGSAVDDLGCSIDFLKTYLEAKFLPGMTWDNWSTHGWHIDHIIPLDSFDLTDREQLLKACHYTNLQPLWATDNIKKSNKIIDVAG